MADIVQVIAEGQGRTGDHLNVYHFQLSPGVSGVDVGLLGLDLWNKIASIYNQIKPHMDTLWQVARIVMNVWNATSGEFEYLGEYDSPNPIVGQVGGGVRSSWESQQIWLDVTGNPRKAFKRFSGLGEGVASANALDGFAATDFFNAAASWFAPLTMVNTGLDLESGMWSRKDSVFHVASGAFGVNPFLGTQNSRKVGQGS